MLYIEELVPGDTFKIDDTIYVLTCDFKKSKTSYTKLAISLLTGNPVWFNNSTVVHKEQLFLLDTENNIIPLKETKKCSID
jgi:hypothetical protein